MNGIPCQTGRASSYIKRNLCFCRQLNLECRTVHIVLSKVLRPFQHLKQTVRQTQSVGQSLRIIEESDKDFPPATRERRNSLGVY